MENPPISAFNRIIGVPVAYSAIRFYLSLMRIRVDREELLLSHLQQGGKAIVAFWHQRFFGAIGYVKKFRSLAPSAIISKSRDGELISRVAMRLGHEPMIIYRRDRAHMPAHDFEADEALEEGGRVIVDAGRYLSGTIRLKSGVELHLAPDGVLAPWHAALDLTCNPRPDSSLWPWISAADTLSLHGHPTIVFGPGGLDQVGTDHECVDVRALQQAVATAAVATLALRWKAPGL
jgi:hypothetical protein